MRAVIVMFGFLVLLPATTRAQLDPTVPVPPKVVSIFLAVLDLGPILGVSTRSSIPGPGRLFHTATTWTEDTEVGTADNPVGVIPTETRGFILVAGGGTLCPNGNIEGSANAVAYGPFVDTPVVQFPSVQPGPMTTSRILHTATLLTAPTAPLTSSPPASLLNDGRILLTGGQSNAGLQNVLASAEVYDPNTHAFTATGPMNEARVTQRAARLLDGRVLIVGGVKPDPTDPACSQPTLPPCQAPPGAAHCAGLALASAEIFDPTTGTFTPTGSMSTPRAIGHSATLLSDGRVLVAGGITNPPGGPLLPGVLQPALDTTEIYDPATGTFSPGPNMTAGRANHTATRLFHVDAPSAFCQPSPPLPPGLCLPVSSIFSSRVLMAGGSAQAGLNEIFAAPLASAETYAPSTNSFSAEGSMATARTLHAAELLPHGKVLVTGGAPSNVAITNTAEVFNPGEGPNPLNALLPAGPGTFVPTNLPMNARRYTHTISLTPTTPGGTAIVIGGVTAAGPAATAETYIP